jgi:hypothetical protein
MSDDEGDQMFVPLALAAVVLAGVCGLGVAAVAWLVW